MKHNAFTSRPVRLYQVWGDADYPFIDCPAGTRIYVLWSPTLKQWIASITTIDYRYDSILSTNDFVLDASLLPVHQPEAADRYYLHQIIFQNRVA